MQALRSLFRDVYAYHLKLSPKRLLSWENPGVMS